MLRHSRGFGIHSPFAYRFITEVLNQPYAYYSYAQLPEHRQQLLFRIALHLGATRAAVYGDRGLVRAVKLALPRVVFAERKPDLVVLDAACASADEAATAADAIAAGADAVIFNSCKFNLSDRIRTNMIAGMTFDNHCGTFIAVPRPSLPRQDFDVLF